ncbi:tRNA uracil-5-methyltransferase [Nitzschia inconspicua]|uniref:tRNA uracil-5-methyltransferase n=1 Tax=Nitzschia inconspicua TaxID=303405 RepID=A0A9K3Q3T9_9STRA|nr:tRNA uracil-5-methyltransferase [Nitzschia inconspicua]
MHNCDDSDGNTYSTIRQSQEKFNQAAERLSSRLASIQQEKVVAIQSFPCQANDETEAYRCKCSFQILQQRHPVNEEHRYQYAIREEQRPVIIDTFPIANRRIQSVMRQFRDDVLNTSASNQDAFSLIRHNLTSCTLSTSWEHNMDCILTLNYNQPIEVNEWKLQARQLCSLLQLKEVNGRSKGLWVSATSSSQQQQPLSDDGKNVHGIYNTLRDTVYMIRIRRQSIHCNDTHEITRWEVTLNIHSKEYNDANTATNSRTSTTRTTVIPVLYEKPETAFFHPNPNAMTKALQWMLQRLQHIQQLSQQQQQQQAPSNTISLLELYCGCGAHTVALAQTGLLQRILAIELDVRLVQACQHNIALNGVQDIVTVLSCDAGQFSKKAGSKKQPTSDDGSSMDVITSFDILLVDPPKQGLDMAVCDMALQQEKTLQHILYISCGHQALLRDLQRLSPRYEVVACCQLDLFPGTYSIETLVHLESK